MMGSKKQICYDLLPTVPSNQIPSLLRPNERTNSIVSDGGVVQPHVPSVNHCQTDSKIAQTDVHIGYSGCQVTHKIMFTLLAEKSNNFSIFTVVHIINAT